MEAAPPWLGKVAVLAAAVGIEAERGRVLRPDRLNWPHDRRTAADRRTLVDLRGSRRTPRATPEAVRALARRQHWPRRSPNAVGGQTWILVPADRLAANGHAESVRRTPASTDRQDHREKLLLTAGQKSDGQRTPPDTGEQIDRRADEILAAVREATETFTHHQGRSQWCEQRDPVKLSKRRSRRSGSSSMHSGTVPTVPKRSCVRRGSSWRRGERGGRGGDEVLAAGPGRFVA